MDLADPTNVVLNVYAEYGRLEASVGQVLKAAAGDSVRLTRQLNAIASFESVFEMHQHRFDDHNRAMIPQNIARFKTALAAARSECADPPVYPSPVKAAPPFTGEAKRRGRPEKYIDPAVLEHLVNVGYTATKIGRLIGWPVRTVARRLVKLGLRLPGVAPIQRTQNPDGTVTQTHHPTRPPMSSATDEELDGFMRLILTNFPRFGRGMLKGALLDMGHRVPKVRITESFNRVHGPSANPWNKRPVVRHAYSVPGANSVWHHDGNHILIQWKIVLHCFVDGLSRAVIGIGAHGNNLSLTVLRLFLSTHAEWGVPTSLRGDHGVENVKVAWWMQAYRGLGVSAYIWGKSTHNTRIERLWNDTRDGFMLKWKVFFVDLEKHYGLNPLNEAHIWLLHHLYLNSINADALMWKRIWNVHKIALKGRRDASPQELWMESQLMDGIRGYDPRLPRPQLNPEWENLHDDRLEAAAQDRADQGVFERPETRLSYVRCDPQGVTWTPASIRAFDRALNLEERLKDNRMGSRRELWIAALSSLHMLEA